MSGRYLHERKEALDRQGAELGAVQPARAGRGPARAQPADGAAALYLHLREQLRRVLPGARGRAAGQGPDGGGRGRGRRQGDLAPADRRVQGHPPAAAPAGPALCRVHGGRRRPLRAPDGAGAFRGGPRRPQADLRAGDRALHRALRHRQEAPLPLFWKTASRWWASPCSARAGA